MMSTKENDVRECWKVFYIENGVHYSDDALFDSLGEAVFVKAIYIASGLDAWVERID